MALARTLPVDKEAGDGAVSRTLHTENVMHKGISLHVRPTVLTAAALFALGCTESVAPERGSPRVPLFDVAASGGIVLNQSNSTADQRNTTILIKGFNPTNPHRGDAIVATFFWVGPPDLITSVRDVLTTSTRTPVGNKYRLVKSFSAGGVSMATYVATNVQNFPDAYNAPAQDSILAVQATLSTAVPTGGLIISAFTGVHADSLQALGADASATGVSTSPTQTAARPGPITVNAGALAYGVTLSTPPAGVGMFPQAETFKPIENTVDGRMAAQAHYVVLDAMRPVNPEWTWFYENSGCAPSTPCTWLASVLALKPGTTQPPPPPPPPPAPPTTGDLTVTTSTTGLSLDLNGYAVTVEGGPTQAIGRNGSVTFTELDAGDHTVVLSDVAGNCTVSGGDSQPVNVPSGGTASTTFEVTCVPGPATRLVFTVQPSNTAPNTTISPAVKVKAVDAQGNTVTDFADLVTIAIGRNGSLLVPGTLSGTKTVSPSNGVATFSNLQIDQSGDGYTLRVAASGLTGAESAAFNIRALVCVLGVCL
jgi:hypothetical protein